MKKILPIFFSLLMLLNACKDDDNGTNVEGCDIETFKSAVMSENAANNLIASYEETDNNYILNFEDGTVIQICNELVEAFNINSFHWKLEFTFTDNSTFNASYIGQVNINLKPNPSGYNPLAVEVTVQTGEPTKIALRVVGKHGSDSDVYREFSTIGTRHEETILGLYPDYLNTIVVTTLSSDDKVRAIDTVELYGQTIPDFDPQISIITADRANMEPGEYTLVSSLSNWTPNFPYMFDTYGDVRWVLDYRSHPNLQYMFYDVGIERLQNGNLYFGDIPTDKIYEIDMLGNIINTWSMSGYEFHHNVQEKPDGNFLVTVNKIGSTHLNGEESVEDHLIEIDRNSGQIVHEWDFRQLLDENRTSLGNWTTGAPVDWLHINAVIYDPADNTVIISGRGQGVAKVDYNDNLVWILGAHEGWGQNRKGEQLSNFLLAPLDATGVPHNNQVALGFVDGSDFEWNWYQHAPLIMPNGNILLFDNGDFRNFAEPPVRYSRAVEYKIDETNMTVQQVWQYGKNRGGELHSRIISDVDYLPQTGNIMMNSGFNVYNGTENRGGRIVELDYQTKQVYFEAYIGAGGLTFHRAERMPLYID